MGLINFNPVSNYTYDNYKLNNPIKPVEQYEYRNNNTLQYGQDKLAFLGKTQIVLRSDDEKSNFSGLQILKDGTIRKSIQDSDMTISKYYKNGEIVRITTKFKNPDSTSKNFRDIASLIKYGIDEHRTVASLVSVESLKGDLLSIKFTDGRTVLLDASENLSAAYIVGVCNILATECFNTSDNKIEEQVAKSLSTKTGDKFSLLDEKPKQDKSGIKTPIYPCLYVDDDGVKVAYESGTTMVDVYGNVYVLVLNNNVPEKVNVNDMIDKKLLSELMDKVCSSQHVENIKNDEQEMNTNVWYDEQDNEAIYI